MTYAGDRRCADADSHLMEGPDWLAYCPPLDVVTQADTKEAALQSLKEAVQLWFESCIARGVLDEALIEAGFKRTEPGELVPDHVNLIQVKHHLPKKAPRSTTSAFPKSNHYIEVSIPAYIAAGQAERAAR